MADEMRVRTQAFAAAIAIARAAIVTLRSDLVADRAELNRTTRPSWPRACPPTGL